MIGGRWVARRDACGLVWMSGGNRDEAWPLCTCECDAIIQSVRRCYRVSSTRAPVCGGGLVYTFMVSGGSGWRRSPVAHTLCLCLVLLLAAAATTAVPLPHTDRAGMFVAGAPSVRQSSAASALFRRAAGVAVKTDGRLPPEGWRRESGAAVTSSQGGSANHRCLSVK